MGRPYLGSDASRIPDAATRQIIDSIDKYLRDSSRAQSANQPVSAEGSGGVATASYITTATEASLSAERRLVVSSPLTGTDNGPNSTFALGLSTAALGSIPVITYGTAFGAGVASTFVRTDAQLKFPTALMSPTSSATATMSDDGTDMTWTTSLGVLKLVAAKSVEIQAQLAQAVTALNLRQLATGATGGAHVNLDDKAGNPPAPIAGDLWRNGLALNYRRDGITTVDLAAAAAGGVTSTEFFLDFGTKAMEIF